MFDEESKEEELLSRFRSLAKNVTQDYTFSDALLLCFLRARKYKLEVALASLKRYIKMMNNNPELRNLMVGKLKIYLSYQLQIAYQARTINGRPIFVFRAGRWDPSKCTLDDIFRCNVFCLQKIMSERCAQIKGIEAIVDLKDLDLNHAKHFTPSHAKKIADLLLGAFPVRFNGIHIVNQNWIFNILMGVIMQFLSLKIQNRIHKHGNNWESLQNFINPEDLPLDYGGHMESLDSTEWDSDTIQGESVFTLN